MLLSVWSFLCDPNLSKDTSKCHVLCTVIKSKLLASLKNLSNQDLSLETKNSSLHFWYDGAPGLTQVLSWKNLSGNFGQCDFFDKVWYQLWPILTGKGWKFSKIFFTKFFIDPWPIDRLGTIFLKNQSLVFQTTKFVRLKLAKFWKNFWACPPWAHASPNPQSLWLILVTR